MNGKFKVRMSDESIIADCRLLDKVLVIFNVTPSNATVVLMVNGQRYETKQIVVERGATIEYTVSADGYETMTDSIIATNDSTISLELQSSGQMMYAWYSENTAMTIPNADTHYLYTESEQPEVMSNGYFINNDGELTGTIVRVKSYDATTNTITTGWGATATRAPAYDRRVVMN